MAPLTDDIARLLIERFKAYVRNRNNASAWWNDDYAYQTMTWLEKVERESLTQPQDVKHNT